MDISPTLYTLGQPTRLPLAGTLKPYHRGPYRHPVEVDRGGNVVWEYVNPVTAEDGIVTTVITSMHTNILGGWSPFRYAPEHPGLAGRDLSPKGPITEFHAPSDSGE